MQIEKMLRHYNDPRNLTAAEIPVSMSVEFPVSVTGPQRIVEGVRRIKETGWYRSLRRKGLQFIP